MRAAASLAATTVLAMALAGGAAQAGKFKVLHSFCERSHHPCGDGANPTAGLVMDSAGNFFGTTTTGGRQSGTAFELERKEGGGYDFKTIYRFCQRDFCSQNPGPLIVDSSGNLYGTAQNLVFELSPGGKHGLRIGKVLYRFCSQPNCADGSVPVGGLTYAGASSGAPYDGTSPLYGVTNLGGAKGQGVVFNLSLAGGQWAESVLYNFCSNGSKCLDGAEPDAGMIMDPEGNLFGTTIEGGGNDPAGGQGGGVVFELSEAGGSWTMTTIYRFCSEVQCADGAFPAGELAIDETGALIGTTRAGGRLCKLNKTYGCGTIFKLTSDGSGFSESVEYSFCAEQDCRDGAIPLGAVLLVGGSLIGTAQFGGGNDIDKFGLGGGTVFRLSGSTLNVLYRFCALPACADGEYPNANVVMDTTDRLFGVTELGGAFGNSIDGGVVFELTP